MRRCVSRSQPSITWISLGVPSAANFDIESVCLRKTGSFFSADGLVAVWIAKGADDPCFWICLSLSMKTFIMSSINVSPHPRPVVGMFTAIGFTCPNGTESLTYLGDGTAGWRGLWRVSGSQSGMSGSLLDKSVIISEKLHQVGGFTDPPKDKRRQMNASSPFIKMV